MRQDIKASLNEIKMGTSRKNGIGIDAGSVEKEEGLIPDLLGSQTQKGIASYALSANRQRPLAGALNNAIFNSWRRFRNQVLYFAPQIVIGYYAINWAIERFVGAG